MGKQQNEGEGNRTAAKEYNDKTRDFVRSGMVNEAAVKARKAVEGPEGDKLREAEEKAKAEGKGM